jgi:hypothetical protein
MSGKRFYRIYRRIMAAFLSHKTQSHIRLSAVSFASKLSKRMSLQSLPQKNERDNFDSTLSTCKCLAKV